MNPSYISYIAENCEQRIKYTETDREIVDVQPEIENFWNLLWLKY
jgi:hypothetical protein